MVTTPTRLVRSRSPAVGRALILLIYAGLSARHTEINYGEWRVGQAALASPPATLTFAHIYR